MTIPIGLVLFVLGLLVSLVSYIWASLSGKIIKLEKHMETSVLSLEILTKCKDCEPVTVREIKDLFDARFNEFRLELYKNGVLKVTSVRKRVES